jgi:hypothetical protein
MSSPDFQLQPRQDMAVHRFTQYCDTKGILLVHGVGSGKTTTSLTMALNSFDWGEKQRGADGSGTARRIVTVAPSGIFGNFVDDLLKNIPNISNQSAMTEEKDGIDHPDISGFKFTRDGKPFSLYGYKYKYLSEKAGVGDYNTIKKKFKDAVVIFDEAHRLFRPIPSKPAYTLLKIFKQENIIKNTKRFIAMTGTPYNSGFSDIFEMLRFIECSEPIIQNPKEKKVSCEQMSIFYPRNFVSLIMGSETLTKIVDTWVFGIIKSVLNFVPDVLGVDIVEGAIDSKRRLNLAWDYWILGKSIEGAQNYKEWQTAVEIFKQELDKPVEQTNNMIGGNSNSINTKELFNNLSVNERDILLEITKYALTVPNYVERLKNNRDGFMVIDEKFGDDTIFPSYLLAIGSFFKESGIEEVDAGKEYVNNAMRQSSSGKDISFDILKDLSIKEDIEMLNEENNTKQVGGECCPCDETNQNENSYSLYKGTLGDICKRGLQSWFDVYNPYDYEKIADKALNYMSVWDNKMENPEMKFQGRKTKSGERLPGYTSTTLSNISMKGSKHVALIQQTKKETYTYPAKEVLHFYIPYKSEQNFYSIDVMAPAMHNKWWKVGRSTDLENIRNSTLRSIGNYSKDYDRFTSDFAYNIPSTKDTKYPKYSIIDTENDEATPEELSETLKENNVTFNCPKFLRILQHLLVMKTGFMFSISNALMQQPHLVNKNAITGKLVPGDSEKNKEGRKALMQAARCEVYYDDELENYLKQKNIWDKIPSGKEKGDKGVPQSQSKVFHGRLDYDEDFQLNIPYKDATHYFLPLVWSCAGLDKYEVGSNIFASFLDLLGLKYIPIHENSPMISNREKIRGFKKIYPIDKSQEFLDFITSAIFSDVTSTMDTLYEKLKTYIDNNPSLKEHPICVIIHPEGTEGFDCKFNPAIILMEPPNTIGDYEQLCGRVMRTYASPGYTEQPKKMIYQCVCYNNDELNTLFEERKKPWETENMISQEGKAPFYQKITGDIKNDLGLAIEQQKEMLSSLIPKSTFDMIAIQLLGTKGTSQRTWSEFANIYNKWGQAALMGNMIEKDFWNKVISEWNSLGGDRAKLSIWDFFLGTVNYKFGLLASREQRSLEIIKYHQERAHKYETEIVGRDAEGKPLTQKRIDEKQSLVRDKTGMASQVKAAYKRIASAQIKSNRSADLNRLMKLSAENWIIQNFMKIMIDKKIFPDYLQIASCAQKVPNANLLPWCDPFVTPSKENERLVCRPISNYEKIDIKPSSNSSQKRETLLTKFNSLQASNGYKQLLPENIAETKRLKNDYMSSYNLTGVTYKPGKNFYPLIKKTTNVPPTAVAPVTPTAVAPVPPTAVAPVPPTAVALVPPTAVVPVSNVSQTKRNNNKPNNSTRRSKRIQAKNTTKTSWNLNNYNSRIPKLNRQVYQLLKKSPENAKKNYFGMITRRNKEKALEAEKAAKANELQKQQLETQKRVQVRPGISYATIAKKKTRKNRTYKH